MIGHCATSAGVAFPIISGHLCPNYADISDHFHSIHIGVDMHAMDDDIIVLATSPVGVQAM